MRDLATASSQSESCTGFVGGSVRDNEVGSGSSCVAAFEEGQPGLRSLEVDGSGDGPFDSERPREGVRGEGELRFGRRWLSRRR
jgi:hypothetical protein